MLVCRFWKPESVFPLLNWIHWLYRVALTTKCFLYQYYLCCELMPVKALAMERGMG